MARKTSTVKRPPVDPKNPPDWSTADDATLLWGWQEAYRQSGVAVPKTRDEWIESLQPLRWYPRRHPKWGLTPEAELQAAISADPPIPDRQPEPEPRPHPTVESILERAKNWFSALNGTDLSLGDSFGVWMLSCHSNRYRESWQDMHTVYDQHGGEAPPMYPLNHDDRKNTAVAIQAAWAEVKLWCLRRLGENGRQNRGTRSEQTQNKSERDKTNYPSDLVHQNLLKYLKKCAKNKTIPKTSRAAKIRAFITENEIEEDEYSFDALEGIAKRYPQHCKP